MKTLRASPWACGRLSFCPEDGDGDTSDENHMKGEHMSATPLIIPMKVQWQSGKSPELNGGLPGKNPALNPGFFSVFVIGKSHQITIFHRIFMDFP